MDVNVLANVDCFAEMKNLPDGSIDLVLTDPPYGIDLTPQRAGSRFKDTKVINDADLEWLPAFVDEIYRVAKNTVVVFCGWQKFDVFKQAFETKFKIKNTLVWDKDWFGMGNNYRPNFELILLCCKTNVKTHSNNKSNVLKYRRVAPQKLLHSCEKPLALLEDLISELSEPGDVVFDPFMGSGTTPAAAVNCGRQYIGYELDPGYFAIAEERVASAEMDAFLNT